MKWAFLFGILLGCATVVAGAGFYPWIDPPRLPSLTSVVANGGRAEQFLIRLPADRIGTQTSLEASTPSLPTGAAIPEELRSQPLIVEQFKLRDGSGNVIGLAARHWTETDGEAASAWLLVIPSRGSLLLAAPGDARAGVDGALTRAGYRPGAAWSGELGVVTAEEATGAVLSGSDEFEGMDGRFSETWRLAGVAASGELRGTIELDTVTFRVGSPADPQSDAP